MEKTHIEQVAENLMSIQPMLMRTFSRSIKQYAEVTPGMMFVMSSLKKHGIQSMGDIGKCQAMPKPHVTAIVNKLIDQGFVERLNAPNDRRVINIQLTEKGRHHFESIKSYVSQGLKDKLSQLSTEELTQLAESTNQVRNIISNLFTKEC